MTGEESGTRAFDVLGFRRDSGVTRPRWRELADLTESQLQTGIAWLRDLFGSEPVIRVRIGGEWVYSLADNERDAREAAHRELRTQITRMRREYHLFHGIAEKHPTRENLYQEDLARRRLADLEYALAHFEDNGE